MAALLAVGLVRHRLVRCLLLLAAGLALGYGYSAWRAQLLLDDALPFVWEGADIAVVGVVADLSQPRERGTRFAFDVERVSTPGAVVPGRVALTWYPERTPGGAPAPTLAAG